MNRITEIDSALLISNQDGFAPWPGSSLTFSYYESVADLPSYYTGLTIPGSNNLSFTDPTLFSSFTSEERSYVTSKLIEIEQYTNLHFEFSDSPSTSDLTFGGLTLTGGPPAWGSAGVNSTPLGFSGDVWYKTVYRVAAGNDYNPTNGTVNQDGKNPAFYKTLPHEIGHALGLAHPHQSVESIFFGLFDIPFPEEQDNNAYSIMSYTADDFSGATVFEYQLYDIAALQKLYGRNDAYNNLDDNYVTFHQGVPSGGSLHLGGSAVGALDRIFSIWDGGGIDTINAGNVAYQSTADADSGSFIDLRPGHFSSIGLDTGTEINNLDNDGELTGEIQNIGDQNVSIAFGAYIENAIGGDKNDGIVGNILSNELRGGDGNDVIYGDGFEYDGNLGDYRRIDTTGIVSAPGNVIAAFNAPSRQSDKIYGEDGDDWLYGSRGNDRLEGGADADHVDGGFGDDELVAELDDADDVLIGGAGTDTVVYKYEAGNSVIEIIDASSFSGAEAADFGLQISGVAGGTFGADELSSIELGAVEAGSGADAVTITDNSEFDFIEYIDLGSQASKSFDTIDLRTFSRDVDVNLASGIVRDSNPDLFNKATLVVRDAEAVLGGVGNDKFTGDSERNVLDGGVGDDELRGANGDDVLIGGAGADLLLGGIGDDVLDAQKNDSSGDFLNGGVGKDTLLVNDGDTIDGLDKLDRVRLGDAWLDGGERGLPPEIENCDDPGADDGSEEERPEAFFGRDGTIYTLNGTTLIVTGASGTITIRNFINGMGGIDLQTQSPDIHTPECARDPLIIDLDNDGNVVTPLNQSGAYFDIDNDGFAEQVAWSTATDGLLVRDLNQNGIIDNGSELFGDARQQFTGGELQTVGSDGFTALGALDSNFDRVISNLDADFAQLQVWIDGDGDGDTDEGELFSLDSLGIVSIDLRAIESDTSIDGISETPLSSAVTLSDGSSIRTYDAYLAVDQYDTREKIDFEVDLSLSDLPVLIGGGNLSDLEVAMTRDPGLAQMVREFSELDVNQADETTERVEAILLRWTGADTIASDSRGVNINARWLAALESIGGADFNQSRVGRNPRADAAAILISEWHDLVDETSAKLLGQTQLGQVLTPGLKFAAAAFFEADEGTSLTDLISNAAIHAPAGRGSAIKYWRSILTTIAAYGSDLGVTVEQIATAAETSVANTGLSADQIFRTQYIGDASGSAVAVDNGVLGSLVGAVGDDILLLDSGISQVSTTAGGNEILVLGIPNSLKIIESLGSSSVSFADIAQSEITSDVEIFGIFSDAQGNPEIIGSLSLIYQGNPIVEIDASSSTGSVPKNTVFNFSDGGSVSVRSAVLDLLDGQVFDGKTITLLQQGEVAGSNLPDDQLIFLSDGNNQISLDQNSGHDIVYATKTNATSLTQLSVDELRENILIERTGSRKRNITISFADGSASLEIVPGNSKEYDPLDTITFSDGEVLTATNLSEVLNSGTIEADNIFGSYRSDLIDGIGGSDFVNGLAGADDYVFKLGYGSLTIDDRDSENRLLLGAGIVSNDIDFTLDGTDVILQMGSGNDTVRITNGRNRASISELVFDDGSTTTLPQLINMISARSGLETPGIVKGTINDEFLTGTSENETIDGRGGNDVLRGGLGNDTYIFGSGSNFLVDEGFGFDTLFIQPDYEVENLVLSIESSGIAVSFKGSEATTGTRNKINSTTGLPDNNTADDIERILFADGTEIDLTAGRNISGTDQSDILFSFANSNDPITPGEGNDRIFLGNGNYIVKFEEALGNDVIYGGGSFSRPLTLDFSDFVFDENVSFERVEDDLIISFPLSGDSVTLIDSFAPFNSAENIVADFSNGPLNLDDIIASISIATENNDLLFGSQLLDGGAGDDVLIGTVAKNEYVFGRGYGDDIIKEQDSRFGNDLSTVIDRVDTLTFIDLNKDDFVISRDPADVSSIIFAVKDTGETLTLDGSPFDGKFDDLHGSHWIDRIVFADGTETSQREIEQQLMDAEASDGNDVIQAFGYPFSYSSDGGRTIVDAGRGNDLIKTDYRNVSVMFRTDSGNDEIIFTDNQDQRLAIEIISEGQSAQSIAKLNIIEDGTEFIVFQNTLGASIKFERYNSIGEEVGFSIQSDEWLDGEVNVAGSEYFFGGISKDNLLSSDGIDFITGDFIPNPQSEIGSQVSAVFDETLVGDGGNDIISGNGGIDTVIFNIGDGFDTLLSNEFPGLVEFEGPDGNSQEEFVENEYIIQFGAGIDRDDIQLEWSREQNGYLSIKVGDGNDGLLIAPQYLSSILFNDGTSLDLTFEPMNELSVRLEAGQFYELTDASEEIVAEGGGVALAVNSATAIDSFQDLSFDEFLAGSLDASQLFTNTLSFGPSFSDIAELEFYRDPANPDDLVIYIPGTDSALQVINQFAAFNDPGAELGSVYFSVDVNGDGQADWGQIDINSDGEADFASLDSNGDGAPNWINPDFDGDGQPDWSPSLFGDLLDTNGDGQFDLIRRQEPRKTTYEFFQADGTSIFAEDTDGDLIPDQYGIDRDEDLIADRVGTPVVLENISFAPPPGSPRGTVGARFNWLDIAPLVQNIAPPIDLSGENNGPISLINLNNNPTDGADNISLAFGETTDSLAGDDQIRSLFYSGTLSWGVGDGNDVFSGSLTPFGGTTVVGIPGAVQPSAGNTVIFQDISDLNELNFARGGNDLQDLVVTNASSGERLTIKSQYTERDGLRAVTKFELEDGTSFTWSDIAKRVVGIDAGGDNEFGTGDEGGVLDGGQGFDMLRGGTGDDIYVFGRDYDEDTIVDLGGADAIEFLPDVSAADVFFSRTGGLGENLLIEVTGLDRLSMTVQGQFSSAENRVEFFDFDDGTTLGWRDVQSFVLDSEITSSDDDITGFVSDDRIETRGGHDRITGLSGDDYIDGGAGRDTAVYRGSRDQYVISEVDGVTTVEDTISGRDGTDTLVSVEDLQFLGDATDVAIVAPNNAPTIGILNRNIAEDAVFSISQSELLASAVDADGDTVILASVDAATNGQAWIGANGNVFFKPTANFSGDASFLFTVNDGNGGTTQSSVNLTVAGDNDAPELTDTITDVILPEDSAIDFELPENLFVDPDGDPVTLGAQLSDGSSLPEWLSFENGRFVGTPPANFNGTLDVVVNASDGSASSATGFSITLQPINDAPVQVSALQDVESAKGEAFSFNLPANLFDDPDGDVLTLTATLANGDPLPAWLIFDGISFSGQAPLSVDAGEIEIRVFASDGNAQTSALFTLDVIESNSAPEIGVPIGDQSSNEDQQIDLIVPVGTFTDVDGDILSLTAALADGNPLPAWLVFDGTRFTGTPPQDFNGTLDLTVTASDGSLEVSDNFTLTIDPVNDAPVLSLMMSDQTSLEDEPIDFLVPADTFADVDGDSLTLSATLADGSDLPAWLSFDGARFTGQPPQDFNGMIELALTASDGELEATDLFALSISPVNDPPVILTPLADVSSAEDSLVDVAIPTDTFVDVDGDTLTLTATLSDGSDLPAWLSFDGVRITGTPPQDFNGNIDIAVTASDGELDIVDHFVLTIDPVNDAPVVLNAIAGINADEDTVVNVALPTNIFSDVDGDALVLSATLVDGSELPVWLSFDGVRFAGMPPVNFNGALDIRVTANDGALQVSNDFVLTIDPVNDAPILDAVLSDISSDEDTAFDVALPQDAFSDIEGDALTLTAALVGGDVLPDWVSFDGERFTGTPPQDFNGVLDIEVTASDGQLGTAGSFALTIDPINDAPVAVDDDIFLSEGGDELTILQSSLLDNDSDVDGDTLSVVSVTDGANGTVGFDADGNIVYTPNAGFQGEDSFTYTISDGELTSTATAQLRVDDPFSGWRQGTEGNDFLFGNFFRANEIFGRAGNDYIFGGFRADYLAGGDGNDRVFGLFGDDHLWGNGGDDKLYGGFGTDTAYFSGTSSEYELQTQLGGFYVRTRDEDPTVNGDDGRDQLYSIERLTFSDGETISVSSPIILDLDGDGTEFVSASESSALFDLDNDGVRDDTSWIGSGDAFLFLDRNGDGFVSGVNEISFVDDVEDARSDLDGLRSFDSNGDGILSSGDERFSEFGVWQDLDTDGEVDAGETFSLAGAGVVSIDLNAEATDAGFTLGEVAVVNQGRFLRSDGTTSGYADAAITFFQKGVPELPKIEFDVERFSRKSKKYRLFARNGELMIGTKKRGPSEALAGASTLQFKNKSVGLLTPIVLDLDGDGIELVKNKKTKVRFDIDGNGSADKTGWIGRNDGFLVVDRNNNGTIDNGSELSFLVDAPNAKSDLQALTAFDSNGDGIVSSLDVRFNELKIWVDGNANGQTDTGELRTLNDQGIASVSLDGQATNDRVKLGNNILLATSTFTRTDGSIGAVGDAVLAFTPSAAPQSYDQNVYSRRFTGDNTRSAGEYRLQAAVEGRFAEPEIPYSEVSELSALRAGLDSGNVSLTSQGLAFDAAGNSNVFDYYEQANTDQAEADVTSDIVSKEAIPAPEAANNNSAEVNGTADALKIALMTQDMSVFGASSGATMMKERERTAAMMDYFVG